MNDHRGVPGARSGGPTIHDGATHTTHESREGGVGSRERAPASPRRLGTSEADSA